MLLSKELADLVPLYIEELFAKQYITPNTTEKIQSYKTKSQYYYDVHPFYRYYPKIRNQFMDPINTENDLEFLPLPEPLRVDNKGFLDITHFQNFKVQELWSLYYSLANDKKIWKYQLLKHPLKNKKNMKKKEIFDTISKILFGNLQATKILQAKFLFNLSPHFKRRDLYYLLWYYEDHKIKQRFENKEPPLVKGPCKTFL